MSLCLSRTEVAELTRTPRKRGQVAFLVKNGIRHYLDAHGWPVVPRSAIEDKPAQVQTPPVWTPSKAA